MAQSGQINTDSSGAFAVEMEEGSTVCMDHPLILVREGMRTMKGGRSRIGRQDLTIPPGEEGRPPLAAALATPSSRMGHQLQAF